MKCYRIFAPILIFLVSPPVCIAQAPKPYFVIVPGARAVDQTVFQGQDQLIYRVQAEYPALGIVNLIKVRLAKRGWRPLKEDRLNPGLPSSIVRGWMYFADETTKSKTSVRAWSVDWTNQTGDKLRYWLEYRCPGDLCASTQNLHDLKVIAIHTPADLAKRQKQQK